MFTDNEIISYHNIKAPDDLRQKITKSQKKSKKVLYIASTIAACFIFIISCFVINNQSNIVINGQILKDSIVFYDNTISLGRTVSPKISVPLEIKTSHSTKITVAQGVISADGSNQSKELVISSPKMILWEIEPNPNYNLFEMQISSNKGVEKVTLQYENGKITATKEKEKWKKY